MAISSDLLKPATAGKFGTFSPSDFAKLATVPSGVGLVLGGALLSPEVDFTAVAETVIISPLAWRLSRQPITLVLITAKDGTVSNAPTLSLGTNAASFDNTHSSQSPAGFVSSTADQLFTLTLAGTGATANLSLAADGWKLNVTVGAVLGTATMLRGRLLALTPGVFDY